MNGADVQFQLTFSSYYFIPVALILLLLSVYIYKVTIPPIGKGLKTFLIALRSLALLLIIAAIFEPKVDLSYKHNVPKKVALFVDNSESLKKHSKEVLASVKKEIARLERNNFDLHFFTFGEKIRRIEKDSLQKIIFTENLTTYDVLFDTLKNIAELDAVIIISDGNITNGSYPVNTAEMLGIPIYTIGVGDTILQKDIGVRRVVSNSILYLNKKAEIRATVKNSGFAGVKVPVALYENGKLVEQKNVTLSEGGINNLTFLYTPKTLGEKQMSVAIPKIHGDFVKGNNKKNFYVKVLDSKIRIALVCGSPSADFSFVKNSLKKNEEFKVAEIVEISKEKKFNITNARTILDSSNVLFLIGFPASNSSPKLIELVKQEIRQQKKPFLLLFSNGLSFERLAELKDVLSFDFQNIQMPEIKASPFVQNTESPIFRLTEGNESKYWNNLPPVDYLGTAVKAKPLSETIATANIDGKSTTFPFIIKYSKGGRRSITITAGNIWRWKLQPENSNSILFDDFVKNIAKWLNAASRIKRFRISPQGKIFFKGEPVCFQAEVLDESLAPVNTADVEVQVSTKKENARIVLVNEINGIYEGCFENLQAGEYSYSGKISDKGKQLFTTKGKFLIEDVNPELLKTNIDKGFLKLLAKVSGGYYADWYNIARFDSRFFSELAKTKKTKTVKEEYRLWSYSVTLIVIIFLFSLEWLLRKRAGLL